MKLNKNEQNYLLTILFKSYILYLTECNLFGNYLSVYGFVRYGTYLGTG